jgi:hypothetical protein
MDALARVQHRLTIESMVGTLPIYAVTMVGGESAQAAQAADTSLAEQWPALAALLFVLCTAAGFTAAYRACRKQDGGDHTVDAAATHEELTSLLATYPPPAAAAAAVAAAPAAAPTAVAAGSAAAVSQSAVVGSEAAR